MACKNKPVRVFKLGRLLWGSKMYNKYFLQHVRLFGSVSMYSQFLSGVWEGRTFISTVVAVILGACFDIPTLLPSVQQDLQSWQIHTLSTTVWQSFPLKSSKALWDESFEYHSHPCLDASLLLLLFALAWFPLLLTSSGRGTPIKIHDVLLSASVWLQLSVSQPKDFHTACEDNTRHSLLRK